jgi:TonB family protein
VGLTLIIWFGSHVTRQVMPRQRTINVRVTSLSQPRPEVRDIEPVVQDPPPVEQQEPEPVVEDTPQQEPAIVPEEPVRETVVEEIVPETKPAQPDPAPDTVVEDPAPATETVAPAVVGTDVVVPARFKYYIDLLEQRIARNWHPKQLGFRSQSTRVCKIHFHVEQNGLITRETMILSSGVPLMDRESLKAVKTVGHFMPLPRGLADNALGVTYTFTLTAGN